MALRMILSLVLSTLIFSCKKDPVSSEPAKEMRDISYGDAALQKMDILFPAGYTDKTPVVFLIHGGGFIAGVKEDFEMQAQKFREQNFIVVNLSHRLIDTDGLLSVPPEHKLSTIKVSDEVKDMEAAVNYFMSHAADYNAGTGRMYMAGHSAGATLSMLYVQSDLNKNGQVRASANWAGLTDLSITDPDILNLLDPRWTELLYRTTGKMPTEENALYFMAISPYWVTNLNKGMPNITIFPENNLVFQVEGEKEYQYQTTKNYHVLLKNKGVAEKLVYYEGEDHGFGTKQGSWEKLIKETAEFFKGH